MRVLTVNTGSSSVKLRVLDADDRVVTTRDSTPDDLADDAGYLVRDVDAVGHRIVHGGPDHVAPARELASWLPGCSKRSRLGDERRATTSQSRTVISRRW